jgi:hypothetical protein
MHRTGIAPRPAGRNFRDSIRVGGGKRLQISPDSVDKVGRASIFDDITGRARIQTMLHDSRIVIHAEHDDASLLIVRPDTSKKRQACEGVARKREIDHDDVRLILLIERVPSHKIAGEEDRLDSGGLKKPSASLSNERMVVDDQYGSHGTICTCRLELHLQAPSSMDREDNFQFLPGTRGNPSVVDVLD